MQLLRLLKHCKSEAKFARPKTGDSTTIVIPPSRGRLLSRKLSPKAILPSISDPMFAIDPMDENIAVYKDVVLVSG